MSKTRIRPATNSNCLANLILAYQRIEDEKISLAMAGLELAAAKELRQAAIEENIQAQFELSLALESEYQSRIMCAEMDFQARLNNLES